MSAAEQRTSQPLPGYEEVYRRVALYDFGWEVKLGFNLAFYRRFAVPSIGGLHPQTGEMTQRAQNVPTTPGYSGTS